MKRINRSTVATHLPQDVPADRETPLIVCYGAGVDSTAMLVGLAERGERPDLVIFADTGSEKRDTYLYIPIIRQWLRDVGFPELVVVRKTPPIANYDSLYGNCVENETLPSVAFFFRRHSCSHKWKIEPMETWRRQWPAATNQWDAGRKCRKLIGFDSTESHRTFRQPKSESERYELEYPLRSWGWDRDRCKREIRNAGLPVPPKSACFFCPAAKAEEILALRRDDPEQFKLAVQMEQRYRNGKHYRGPLVAGEKETVQGLGVTKTWSSVVINAYQQGERFNV